MGFSVSINSNKLFLLISSAEPLNILHKSTTIEKIGIYEIYDFEYKVFKNSLVVEGDFLLVNNLNGTTETIKHNIYNHHKVFNDLIFLLNDDIETLKSSDNYSVFLDNDILKKNNKLTFDEIVSNYLIYIIGGIFLFTLIIWILSKVA